MTGVGVAQAMEAAGGRPPLRRPYAAPEQTGRLGWDHRADIYALGVLATELLVGRRPSGGGAGTPVSDLLVQGEGLDPEACRRALAQALADSPAARPHRASDLVAALKAAVTEPDEDEQDPLDLPLRVTQVGGALHDETPDASRETPDEELAAVLASDDAELMVQEQAFTVLDEPPAEAEPLEAEALEAERGWREPAEPDFPESEGRDAAFGEPAYRDADDRDYRDAEYRAPDRRDAAPDVSAFVVPVPGPLVEAEDDEGVYGGTARVSALRHEESTAGPVAASSHPTK